MPPALQNLHVSQNQINMRKYLPQVIPRRIKAGIKRHMDSIFFQNACGLRSKLRLTEGLAPRQGDAPSGCPKEVLIFFQF